MDIWNLSLYCQSSSVKLTCICVDILNHRVASVSSKQTEGASIGKRVRRVRPSVLHNAVFALEILLNLYLAYKQLFCVWLFLYS